MFTRRYLQMCRCPVSQDGSLWNVGASGFGHSSDLRKVSVELRNDAEVQVAEAEQDCICAMHIQAQACDCSHSRGDEM